MDARYLCGFQQTFLVDVAVVNSNVAGDAFREDDTVLHDHSALAAPPFLVERVDVRTSYIDLTLQDRIVAEHEFNERRLSAARGADDGRHLSLGDVYRHVVQGFAQSMRVVLEYDVLNVDALAVVGQRGSEGVLSVFVLGAVNLVDALQADFHVLQGVEEVHELLHG